MQDHALVAKFHQWLGQCEGLSLGISHGSIYRARIASVGTYEWAQARAKAADENESYTLS